MHHPLAGRTALVTGAASGIGRAAAFALAAAGARVAVADVDERGGEETVDAIQQGDETGFFHQTDVSDPASVAALFEAIEERWGRLDVAFNNAGIEGQQGPLEEGSMDNWNRVLDVNLRGAWLCLKHELRLMRARGGAIANCASVAGLVGLANAGPYVASKHGLIGLTRTAALEGAPHKIRVNAVCPGAIETPMLERYHQNDPKAKAALAAMHPLGRLGQADEIANAVVWLLSDQSAFVTGQALAVDGGWTMH